MHPLPAFRALRPPDSPAVANRPSALATDSTHSLGNIPLAQPLALRSSTKKSKEGLPSVLTPIGPLEMELLATIGNALVYPGDFDLCLFPVVRPFPFSRPPGLQPSQLALQGFETLGPFPADAVWQGVLLTVIRREGCIGRQDGLLQQGTPVQWPGARFYPLLRFPAKCSCIRAGQSPATSTARTLSR